MKTLCINLDSRPDRWAQAQAEFDRVGLKVERVSAVSGDNKPLAFNQSVYKCMEMARGGELLLFEDDVVFDCNHLWNQIPPKDFMSLHYGCNIMGQWEMPIKMADHLAQVRNCWQSHATLYSARCVDFILANLDPNRLDEDNCIFDEWFRRKVLSQHRSCVTIPMIAYQRPSFSDIWNTQADYTQCHIDGNKYLATL
jgi:hypothetical protein